MADYSIEVAIPNQGPKGDTGEVPEAPEDATPYARKDGAWTPTVELNEDGSVPAIVQVRQGTAAELGEIVLNDGELAIELEGGVPKQLKVGDGTTLGGVAPSINDWNIVEGTSDDDQTTSENTTLAAITLFDGIPNLEIGAMYQFTGRAYFELSGEGGLKLSTANPDAILNNSFARTGGGEWADEYVFLSSYQEAVTDFGYFDFWGTTRAVVNGNRFRLFFAQQTSSADELVFRGAQSYLLYRIIT